MILFLFSMCFALQNIIHVYGTSDARRRFIVENGVKPPIFGSYSYDPLKQKFDLVPSSKNRTAFISEIINSAHILSTAVDTVSLRTIISQTETRKAFTEASYRKRVTEITQTQEQQGKRSKSSVYYTTTKHRVF